MPGPHALETRRHDKSLLDRALSLFTDVRAGEGATAVLMLINIFVLLICYSVIKTVREPLILLGGGAEVRSYAAAGQALLLMGFVPLYSWFASRVDRARLLVGVTLFFIACIELFASAVAARVPYVGVAFFIWVGIFNMSLVAQFWSFANDIYSKEAGDRLFPIIVIGMTAGAPLGSLVAARLFRLGVHPQSILQISAMLLAASVLLYLWINRRDERRRPDTAAAACRRSGGFQLVLGNKYLRLIAALIVLLNVVNTTGEYLISRLLTAHVKELAALNPAFNRQAFIGAYAGDYQFWVNVTAFLLQAFVASRLVKHRGLAGVLLALPLIALGGYSIIAAGAGSRSGPLDQDGGERDRLLDHEHGAATAVAADDRAKRKYKAKQAIDTFFVRSGDVLSAAAVFVGTAILHLTVPQFAAINIVLTLVWLTIAVRIAYPQWTLPRAQMRRMAAAATGLVVPRHRDAGLRTGDARRPARGRARRQGDAPSRLPADAARRPDSDGREPARHQTAGLPVHRQRVRRRRSGDRPRLSRALRRLGDDSTRTPRGPARNYKAVSAQVRLPEFANRRLLIQAKGDWLDAPIGHVLRRRQRDEQHRPREYAYRSTTIGASARLQAAKFVAVGAGMDVLAIEATNASPTYRRSRAFAQFDWRTSPSYTQARRTLPRRLVRLSRHQVRRRLQLPPRRRGSESVRADSARELGDRAARRRLDDRRRRRKRRAVLPDAGSRRQPLAARISDLALPRSQPAALHRRVPLDRRPVRRHGAVRRRRQGRAARRATSICADLKKSYGIGVTLHTPSST